MRQLEVDFIKQQNVSPVGVCLIVLSLIVLVAELYHYQLLQAENTALETKIQTNEAILKPKASQKPKTSMSQEQLMSSMQHAHQLADFLLLPWMDVFAALEASADPDVAILGIEPEPKKQVVKIIAEAKDKEHMFEYMKKLEATPQLTGVYLMRHEVEEEATQHPIRFVVAANWLPHVLSSQKVNDAPKLMHHEGANHE